MFSLVLKFNGEIFSQTVWIYNYPKTKRAGSSNFLWFTIKHISNSKASLLQFPSNVIFCSDFSGNRPKVWEKDKVFFCKGGRYLKNNYSSSFLFFSLAYILSYGKLNIQHKKLVSIGFLICLNGESMYLLSL